MDYHNIEDNRLEEIAVACEPNRPIELGIVVVSAQPLIGGIQISSIQPDSCIHRNGRFRVGDTIIKVNDVSLRELRLKEAQILLKNELRIRHSNNAPLILTVLHGSDASQNQNYENGHLGHENQNNQINNFSNIHAIEYQNYNATQEGQQQQQRQHQELSGQHFVGALNTRKIGVVHRIQLVKGNEGLGFKIAKRDNQTGAQCPIFITTINSTGAAVRDGRLKPGDMLLEVNGQTMAGKSQEEAASIFKSIAINQTADIVISRQEEVSNPENKNTENVKTFHDGMSKDLNNDEDEETLVFDVPLNDTKSAGLGISLKGPRVALDGKPIDLGIWVDKIITGGAAWKDGRLMPDDQIIAINGISLIGLSNAEAKNTLTKAACRLQGPEAVQDIIKLTIIRRRQQQSNITQEGERDLMDLGCEVLDGQILKNGNAKSLSLPESNCQSYSDQTQNSNKTMNNNKIQNHEMSLSSSSSMTSSHQGSQNCSAPPSSESQSSFRTVIDQTNVNTSANSGVELSSDASASDNSSDQSRSSTTNNNTISSPLTQASNSLRLTTQSSIGDQSIGKYSDDSQKTIATTTTDGDLNENQNNSFYNHNQSLTTKPKVIDDFPLNSFDNHSNLIKPRGDENDDAENDAEKESCEESESEAPPGGENFQRDGFGRQSISEKRHAQLSAINTDTYRRSRKAKEERERLLRDQSEQERKRLIEQANNKNNRRSLNLNHSTHHNSTKIANLNLNKKNQLDSGVSGSSGEDVRAQNMTRVISQQHRQQISPQKQQGITAMMITTPGGHRECPVDVQMPNANDEAKFEVDVPHVDGGQHDAQRATFSYSGARVANHRFTDGRTIQNGYHTIDSRSSRASAGARAAVAAASQHSQEPIQIQESSRTGGLFAPACCWKCRSPGQNCPHHSQNESSLVPPNSGGRGLKKSNSLESLMQTHQNQNLANACYTNPIDPFTGGINRHAIPNMRPAVGPNAQNYAPHHQINNFQRDPSRESSGQTVLQSAGPSLASTTITMQHDDRTLLTNPRARNKEPDLNSTSSSTNNNSQMVKDSNQQQKKSLFRFFKLGSRKGKKQSSKNDKVQDSCQNQGQNIMQPDKMMTSRMTSGMNNADGTSHAEFSDDNTTTSGRTSASVTNHSRANSYSNGTNHHHPRSNSAAGLHQHMQNKSHHVQDENCHQTQNQTRLIARQQAQHEKELINAHYMKMLQQQQFATRGTIQNNNGLNNNQMIYDTNNLTMLQLGSQRPPATMTNFVSGPPQQQHAMRMQIQGGQHAMQLQRPPPMQSQYNYQSAANPNAFNADKQSYNHYIDYNHHITMAQQRQSPQTMAKPNGPVMMPQQQMLRQPYVAGVPIMNVTNPSRPREFGPIRIVPPPHAQQMMMVQPGPHEFGGSSGPSYGSPNTMMQPRSATNVGIPWMGVRPIMNVSPQFNGQGQVQGQSLYGTMRPNGINNQQLIGSKPPAPSGQHALGQINQRPAYFTFV